MSINCLSTIQSITNKSVKAVAAPTTPVALIKYIFNNNLTNLGSAGTAYNGTNNNLSFSTTSPSPSTSVNNYSVVTSNNGATSNYQYFTVPAMSSIITTSNGVTVTFWFSPRGNVSGDSGLAAFGGGINGTQYSSFGGTPVATLHCVTASNQMKVNLSFSPNISSNLAYSTWHHLALVMDITGTTPKYSLYIDNVAIANNIVYNNSADGNTYLPTFTDFWTIGAIIKGHGWGQFNGAISDFRIYNMKLTAAHVSSIYNNLL